MKLVQRAASLIFLFAILASLFPTAAFAADDWDVAGGHFFTQTGGGGGKGYTVTDDNGVRFWSEFKRLGGVSAVGYPASRRFQWDGFTVQVFQRVIFQWHPETNSVAFVNTFDRLHDLGKDDWLLAVRQTPAPIKLDESGKSWNQIVAGRLALLNAAPAIKAKYYAVVGDPIQANGLPTSAVTDMGNHLALRAQRVEFQLWKQDVPWAKAGTVTVALGGDIAKEAGILPSPLALQPGTPDEIAKGISAGSVQWAVHSDGEKSFKYPADWKPYTQGGVNDYESPDHQAAFLYAAPFNMGPTFNQQDFITAAVKANSHNSDIIWGDRFSDTINGYPIDVQAIGYSDGVYGLVATVKKGGQIHLIMALETPEAQGKYTDILTQMVLSYTPK
ncbi:MAG TPA: hypothetical protein VFZ25_05540 [Chloroflexota bacterium]|nr:hypothetical protein [Chloroflexota bacterium]